MQPYFAFVPFRAAPTSQQAVAFHSPLYVSLVYKIESRQIRRKLFALRLSLVTLPILVTLVETFRPTSLLNYAAAPAGTVLATNSASANADYDNGTTFQLLPRYRRDDERATVAWKRDKCNE